MLAPALVLAATLADPQPPPRIQARSHTSVGDVVRVVDGRRLEVKDASGTSTFELPADVRLVSQGRVARLADVVPGRRVVVTCEDDAGGGHRAVQVRLVPSPTPSPRAQP